jgi:hypothetical protein
METFDFTNKEGLRKIAKFYGRNWWKISYHGLFLAKKLWDSVMGSEASIQQAQAAEKLIQKGKDVGVDEMEIIINNDKGVHVECPTEDGVKIDATIGSDEKMHIKVKYK